MSKENVIKDEEEKKEKRGPRIGDEKIKQIVVERFTPDPSTGKLPRIKDLHKKYGYSHAAISRTWPMAARKGLVKVVAIAPEYSRSAQLEAQLCADFGLGTAIVVDTPKGASGDAICTALGQSLASALPWGLVFSDGDVVGIGGGRSIFETAAALKGVTLHTRGVKLVSLTGDTFARCPDPTLRAGLEADLTVHMFAELFAKGANQIRIASPVVSKRSVELGRDRVIGELNIETWQRASPTKAILGMGVLTEDHHWFTEFESDKRDPRLAPIMGYLEKMIACCERTKKNTNGGYVPLGELLNHYFFIEPPREFKKEKSRCEREIKETVEKVNASLITFDEVRLKKISNIMLVAGSLVKARGIFHVLTHRPEYPVSLLCTNSETAMLLHGWKWRGQGPA